MINTPAATHRVTVIDALGRDAALAAAVDGLYDRLLADAFWHPTSHGCLAKLTRTGGLFMLGGDHAVRRQPW